MTKRTRHPTQKEFTPGHGSIKGGRDEVSDSPAANHEQIAKARRMDETCPELADFIRALARYAARRDHNELLGSEPAGRQEKDGAPEKRGRMRAVLRRPQSSGE